MTPSLPRKRRFALNTPGHAHELTFSCFKGIRQFDDEACRTVFLEELNSAKRQLQFRLWAYVVMPEHVHLLIDPLDDDYKVANILKSIKQPVSQRLIAKWRTSDMGRLEQIRNGRKDNRPLYSFWQPGGGYDRNVYKPSYIWSAIEYIHMNPVRRGLVASPHDWQWSSAAAYLRLGVQRLPVDICDVRM